MAEIGGLDLGKKIGPFPLGIWIVAVAGGLGIAYVVNRGMLTGGGGDTIGTGGATIESGIGGTPGGFVPAPQPEEGGGGILDNEMWAFEATSWLVLSGYSALKAGTAVRKYLDGERLSSEEAMLIDRVGKSRVGLPPQIPVGGGIQEPKETPLVPDTPPKPRATLTSKNRLGLSWWPGSKRAVVYEVRITTPGKASHTKTDSQTGAVWRDWPAPFVKSRTYTVQVRAKNSAGYSSWSPPTTFRGM